MNKLKYFIPIAVIAFIFSACKYDFIIPEKVVIVDPNDPNAEVIKFSESVLPIFNGNNNCTSCHKTGGQAPDLTTANAFSAINSSRYVNKTTPAESKIYTHPSPLTTTHSQKKYTEAQAAIVLGWITQGAKNN